MKKVILILIIHSIILPIKMNAQINTDEIKEIAKQNLEVFLNLIPEDAIQKYGFSSRVEFKDATIGQPIPVFAICKDFFIDANCIQKIVFSNEWRVPVLLEEKYIQLLTAKQPSSDYENLEIVDMGGAGLAHYIDSFMTVKDISQVSIVRIYPLKYDYIVDKNDINEMNEGLFYKITNQPVNKGLTLEEMLEEITINYKSLNNEK